MLKNYLNNIPLLYTFNFFYMFLIIVPIIVPYFLHLGLSMEDIFIIQAFFGLSMALFEVPSAYLGDLWGRRNVLIFGSFITGIGFSCLYIATDFWSLLGYELLLGVGASFVSGADLSLVYDSLTEDRLSKAKAISNLHGLQLLGEAIAAIFCSILMVYGFQSVINFQIFVGWIPFIISLFLVEPDREVMSKASHKKNFQEVLSYIFVDHHFIRLIFINLVVWSLSTFIAVWIIQKYWQDNHIKLEQIGIFWMLCNLVAAVSGKYAHSFENKIGSRKILVLMSLMPVVAYITMGFLPGLFGLGATLLFYVSRGINMVVMKEAFNHRIPSKFRNTANSLISLFFRLSFFVVGPLVGYSIDRFGMHLTLQGIGFCFALIFIFLMLPFLKKIPQA